MQRRVSVTHSVRVVLAMLLLMAVPATPVGAILAGPDFLYSRHKLVASDGEAGDLLGDSVAVSGDVAVVGAPLDDDRGARAGAAYVFVRSGETWVQRQKLTAGDGVAGQSFGRAVDVSGTTIIVGAPGDGGETDPTYDGAAYVFDLAGASWAQQAKLTAGADAWDGDAFGTSVAVSGNYAAVGEPFDENVGGEDAGSVFVFARSGTSWTLDQSIAPAGMQIGDRFGSAVALSGTTLAVGAPYSNAHWGNDGAVYFFVRDATKWVQQGPSLAPSDAQGEALFGFEVALSGDYAVIGAFLDDDGSALNAGAAYVFERTGVDWNEKQKLGTPDGGTAGDHFGRSVDIEGNTIVIGSPNAQTGPTLARAGAAFVFTRGATWGWAQTLTAKDAAANDLFGSSISIAGDTALVSAIYDDDKGSESGSAYVFSKAATPMIVPSGPAAPPAYNSAPVLAARLSLPSGPMSAGRNVEFERYASGAWTPLGTAATDGTGIASLGSPVLKSAVRFRARFTGAEGYGATGWAEFVVAPKAWLTTPSGPRTAYRNRAFSSAGYLKSKHPAGSYPVKLQCYRYERQRNGSYKWILRKTVSARASNYSSYTKYVGRVALPSRGKWKIRARHLDSSHALTYSSKWRYVTVR